MARIKTIAREDLGEFTETFDKLEAAMGFIPNSLLTMAHRPKLMATFLPLAMEVLAGETSLPQGLRNLIAHIASLAAGFLIVEYGYWATFALAGTARLMSALILFFVFKDTKPEEAGD